MSLVYKIGDLFSSQASVLAHGCTASGKMNAGIARRFKKEFPDMYVDYMERSRNGNLIPGESYVFQSAKGRTIANLMTQDEHGASEFLVDTCIGWLSNYATTNNTPNIAIPKIGCGLGGLRWSSVRKIIEYHFSEKSCELEIWTRPQSSQQ